MGAAARVKVLNMKRKFMKGITCKYIVRCRLINFDFFPCLELPKPVLQNGAVGADPDPKKQLLSANDFLEYQKGDARQYMWDNYFEDVAEGKEAKGSVQYRGQR